MSGSSPFVGTPSAAGMHAAIQADFTYRDALSTNRFTLQPIQDSSAPLDPRLALLARNCLRRIARYPSDGIGYSRKINILFSLLVPENDLDYKFEFDLREAGPGFDLRQVLVKDGLTWDEAMVPQGEGKGQWKGKEKERQAIVDAAEASTATQAAKDDFGCYTPDFLGAVWTQLGPKDDSRKPQAASSDVAKKAKRDASRKSRKGKTKGAEDAVTVKRTEASSTAQSSDTSTLYAKAANGYSCLAFITGALKAKDGQVMEGLAREICYLQAAFELCGCFIGFAVVQTRLTTMIMLDEHTVVIETLNKAIQGRLMSITEFLDAGDAYQNMPHTLQQADDAMKVGHAGWATLWNTAAYAASLVADLPVTSGLKRLESPPAVPSSTTVRDLVAVARRSPSLAPSSTSSPRPPSTSPSSSSDPPSPASETSSDDDVAVEHHRLQQSIARLIERGLQVYWTDPDLMSALIRDGSQGILAARSAHRVREESDPLVRFGHSVI